jgi:hypothetical protein
LQEFSNEKALYDARASLQWQWYLRFAPLLMHAATLPGFVAVLVAITSSNCCGITFSSTCAVAAAISVYYQFGKLQLKDTTAIVANNASFNLTQQKHKE